MTTAWTAEHLRAIPRQTAAAIPPVLAPDRSGLDPARLYWDMWPVQNAAGRLAPVAGCELWMALTATDRGDPALRHFEAKIHWIERRGGAYHNGVLTLFFTAAGTAARAGGYQQELWAAAASVPAQGLPTGWSVPAPLVRGYAPFYMPADAHEGEAGKIKAFRDPAYFRDPADGSEYLAFTASLAGSDSAFNGAFGLARKGRSGWGLLAPCIHADGVNNELERAHLVFHAGHYYAFWSTQTATFAPGLDHAPGGLYGMVADSMQGPWRPLNGSGLVLANPADRPFQTYSWFVDASLTVCSFVDLLPDGTFGGVPAPLLKLELDGEHAQVRAAAPETAV